MAQTGEVVEPLGCYQKAYDQVMAGKPVYFIITAPPNLDAADLSEEKRIILFGLLSRLNEAEWIIFGRRLVAFQFSFDGRGISDREFDTQIGNMVDKGWLPRIAEEPTYQIQRC